MEQVGPHPTCFEAPLLPCCSPPFSPGWNGPALGGCELTAWDAVAARTSPARHRKPPGGAGLPACVLCRVSGAELRAHQLRLRRDERDLRDHIQAGLPSRQLCDLGLAFESGCGSSLQRRPLNPLVPRPSSPRVGAAWGQDRTAGGADSHGRGTQPRVKGVGVHRELQSEGYRDQDSRHGFGVARDRGTGTQR